MLISLTFFLCCACVTQSGEIWHSPHSISSHSGHEKNDFYVLPHGYFGDSHDLTHDRDPTDHSRYVLRVNYKNGTYAGSQHMPHRGAQFYSQPPHVKGHDEMTLSYDVYFPTNFQWVLGGKLPGLWGGTQTCSGHNPADTCFSTRYMWREHREGEVYAYIPHNQHGGFSSWCNHRDIICHDNSGQSIGRGSILFNHNNWLKLTQYVKLNTGKSHNGILKVWMNHNLVYQNSTLLFRNSDNIHIDGLFFSTFYGGDTDSYKAATNTYTLYRDFRFYDNHQDPSGIVFG